MRLFSVFSQYIQLGGGHMIAQRFLFQRNFPRDHVSPAFGTKGSVTDIELLVKTVREAMGGHKQKHHWGADDTDGVIF